MDACADEGAEGAEEGVSEGESGVVAYDLSVINVSSETEIMFAASSEAVGRTSRTA